MKRRSDGLMQKSVTINGKRKYFYGKSVSEINKKILAYQEADRRGPTFQSVADEWADKHFDELKPSTLHCYTIPTRRATEFFEGKFVREITPKDIQTLINKVAAMGYSKKIVTMQKVVMNMILDYAVIQGYVEFNMCASVKIPKGLPQKRREMPTEEDIKKVLEFKNDENGFLPYFIFCTGLRKGEALALEMTDIHDRYLVVNKSITYEGNTAYLSTPKTEAGTRLVPLPSKLSKEIKERFKGQKYLFEQNGTYLTHKKYIWIWSTWQKLSGCSITAHQLRHAYASLILRDMDEFDVKEFIGHKDITTTRNIYSHMTEKRVIDAVKQIDRTLNAI